MTTSAASPRTLASWNIPNDDGRDIVFEGELVARVSSADPNQRRIPAIDIPPAPRWTELRIWRTVGGSYVGQILGRSTVAGERDLSKAEAHSSEESLVGMFTRNGKYGWLAKKLLHMANMDRHIINKVA